MQSNSLRLYRRIADDLTAAIHNETYAVGERLPGERELAEVYGVSRPTIREAMIALEIYGVVEIRHGVGNIVLGSVKTPDDLDRGPLPDDLNVGAFELLEARILIEGGTAALAAAAATDEDIETLAEFIEKMRSDDGAVREAVDRKFHIHLARMTKNGPLMDAVETLWDLRDRSMLARSMESRARGGGGLDRDEEHRLILEAVRQHDMIAARHAMQSHLERVRDYLLEATEAEELEMLREKQRLAREAISKRAKF